MKSMLCLASTPDQTDEPSKPAEESKTHEMDELIHSQSEAYQSQFLQGSIPKLIFKHAMKGFLFENSPISRV